MLRQSQGLELSGGLRSAVQVPQGARHFVFFSRALSVLVSVCLRVRREFLGTVVRQAPLIMTAAPRAIALISPLPVSLLSFSRFPRDAPALLVDLRLISSVARGQGLNSMSSWQERSLPRVKLSLPFEFLHLPCLANVVESAPGVLWRATLGPQEGGGGNHGGGRDGGCVGGRDGGGRGYQRGG